MMPGDGYSNAFLLESGGAAGAATRLNPPQKVDSGEIRHETGFES
jgi:hypothetical protein